MNDDAPLHLHKAFHMGPDAHIEVYLDQPAMVFLMDDANYQNFLQWEAYSAFGGKCDQSPARLRPGALGNWHLVVQQEEGENRELNVRVKLVAERAVREPDSPAPVKKAKKKPGALPEIHWELDDPSMLILQVEKMRKFLTKPEMNNIIHQVVRGKNDLARRKLLFSWLERERRDILMEADIPDFGSPILREMVRQLKERFAPGTP